MESSAERLRLRTKTGCLTCRKRRVKCDESKPHCSRCTSTGRKCDGYALTSPPRYGGLVRWSPPLIATPSSGRGDAQETRAFQFFYERTVPSLSGYCGSAFWNRLVLQVSQHEKSVWHALIALGSLHENFENDQRIPGLWFSRRGYDDFAVREYLLAIRALIGPTRSLKQGTRGSSPAEPLTVDVYLISCILFACFEVLSSHYDSAINHIRAGIKIISETNYDRASGTFCHPNLRPSTVTGLEIGTLRKMLIQLQDQAFTLTREGIDDELVHSTRYESALQHDMTIPDEFHSVAEARDVFEYYRHKAARQLRADAEGDKGTPSTADIQEYGSIIQQFEPVLGRMLSALDRLEQRTITTPNAREQIGVKILKIHTYMHRIRLEYAKLGVSDQMSWDRYNHMFDEMVSLAASMVDQTNGVECLSLSPSQLDRLSRDGYLKPSFTMDLGINGPVFNVATMCRDPIIRRKAVRVLRAASRQEGCYNSHICAVVAEYAIAAEEGAATALLVASGNSREGPSGLSPATLVPLNQGLGSITQSYQVPEEARLAYIYPRVDATRKKVYIRLCKGGVDVDVDIGLPATSAVNDMIL
ncbi:hypothetical protein BJX65DRAFT_71810 [Aspergillus insuetus]